MTHLVPSGRHAVPVRLAVNQKVVEALVEGRTSLLDLIRHIGLTGTHAGCEQGVCGACTVLLDGEPVRSCLVLALQASDCAVTTVESLGDPGNPHLLQQMFSHEHSLQCGFCTPGFLMLALGLLNREEGADTLTHEEIRKVLSSNLCRCTGYEPIVAAVERVAVARGLMGNVRAEPET